MSRNQAIKYAEKYDGLCDQKFIDDFCKYIGISKMQFNKFISKIINKKLFKVQIKNQKLRVKRKFQVGIGI